MFELIAFPLSGFFTLTFQINFGNHLFDRYSLNLFCLIGCTYVLHSSGQLYSHKRKHERRDTELAYRKFKLAQSMMKTLSEAGSVHQSYIPEPVSCIP